LFQYISSIPQGKGKSKKELEADFNQVKVDLIIDSIKAVKGKIHQQKYTFELLGYDFILDDDLGTVMIEVNTNPCFEESNRLLKCLLPRMLDDLFCLTMDPLFNSGDPKRKSVFKLPGDLFREKTQEAGSEDEKHKGYPDD